MHGLSDCPAAEEFEQILRTPGLEHDFDRLARHLETCSRCAETAEQLMAQAVFIQTPAGTAAPPQDPEHEAVEALIGRLKKWHASEVAQATLSKEATPGSEAAEATADGFSFLAPALRPDELGRLGGYRVLKVLGRGGMGIVFLAEDPQLKRPVALKTMKPSRAAHPGARERFLREARAAAAIKHDHIVTIYQVGEDRDVPYLAMELLEGETLESRLQRARRLPVAEVLRISREIAEGLDAAHRSRLIHRDIKPSNIWLESGRVVSRGVVSGTSEQDGNGPSITHDSPLTTHHSPRVKILDFGLARADGDADNPNLTESGFIVGTPAYMAPEQARPGAADHRSDLFSLGCVLYRLCTGEAPFRGTDILTTLAAVARDTPKPPAELNREVPPALSDLVTQLLAKDPAERPSSARAVVEAIEGIEAIPAVRSDLSAATTAAVRVELPDGRPVTVTVGAGETPVGKVAVRVTELPATQKRPRRWAVTVVLSRRWAVTVVLSLLLGILAAGIAVYRIQTDKGELTITSESDDVEVVVKQNGKLVRIVDAKTGKAITLTLRSGTYELELKGDPEGLKLDLDNVSLRRGDTRLAKIKRVPPPIAQTEKVGEVGQFYVGHNRGIHTVAFSPDGQQILTGDGAPTDATVDCDIQLFDVSTRERVGRLKGPQSQILAAAFSADGKRVVAGSAWPDSFIRVWDVESRKVVGEFEHARFLEGRVMGGVYGVAFTADGGHVLSCGYDRTVRMWKVETEREVRRFEGLRSVVRCLAVSRDRRFLACGGCLSDGSILVWEVETGKPVRRFEGHTWSGESGETSVAFSPDGQSIVSGGYDSTMRLWDIPSGKEVRRFTGHTAAINGVSFSPDGGRILSASFDCSVRLWDAETGRELRPPFTGHTKRVTSVSFSPDGRFAVSGSDDSTVRLWRLPDPTAAKDRP
jgi:WD40 repeat protein/serine/threonine protein kinase